MKKLKKRLFIFSTEFYTPLIVIFQLLGLSLSPQRRMSKMAKYLSTYSKRRI